jgi:hypothetical protein
MEEGEEVCDPSSVKKNINFDEVNPSCATDAKTHTNTLEVPPPPPAYTDPWDRSKIRKTTILQMTWQHRRPPTITTLSWNGHGLGRVRPFKN